MSAPTTHRTVESPIGDLLLIGDGEAISCLYMNGEGRYDERKQGLTADPAAFAEAAEQLDQYFAGEREHFELDLRPAGSEFQLKVWRALEAIPFGQTRSYGEIAAAVGQPKAARAVGGANNKNPIAVIVPCHRVIGASGALVGYGGGIDRKVWLLDHERAAERSANSSS